MKTLTLCLFLFTSLSFAQEKRDLIYTAQVEHFKDLKKAKEFNIPQSIKVSKLKLIEGMVSAFIELSNGEKLKVEAKAFMGTRDKSLFFVHFDFVGENLGQKNQISFVIRHNEKVTKLLEATPLVFQGVDRQHGMHLPAFDYVLKQQKRDHE